MSIKLSDLSRDEVFYGFIADYLDGELPSDMQNGFKTIIEGRDKEIAAFQYGRGRFQQALGVVFAPEPLKHKLRTFLQDDKLRESIEASEIQDLEKNLKMSLMLRRSLLGAIVVGVLGSLVYLLMPKKIDHLNIIEYLGYEAVAIEEDQDGRVSLPSDDIEEIKQFVAKIPGLRFEPKVFSSMPSWKPKGVTIIDYEVTKVVGVLYESLEPTRSGEFLHHFSAEGVVTELPMKSEDTTSDGLTYRVYASDKINMLVWQQGPNSIGILAGRPSAPDLANLVKSFSQR
jgi:hypothetical protein